MPKVDATEYAQKWKENLDNSTARIKAQVAKVTVSPTLEAIKKKDKMKANIVKAIDNGKWERGLRSVTLEDWKDKMINVGVDRIPTGTASAQPKMKTFGEKLLAYEAGLQAKIKGMPDLTLEQNISRMVTFVKGMSEFQK